MKTPQAWMREPRFTVKSSDGIERCSVTGTARIDRETFKDLQEALSNDYVFRNREQGLAYIMKLGIETYLSGIDERKDG